MKKASEKILETLKNRGYRVTGARREILCILQKTTAPLTIKEVATRANADEASVYRTISLLRQEGLLGEIAFGKKRPRFELTSHHHHHMVCESCGKVAHIEGDAEPQRPRRVPGFSSITGHELTYYGLCRKCA